MLGRRAVQLRREEERRKRKSAYLDHGLVFAHEDGDALRPDHVSELFGGLIGAVRFEDDAHLPDRERRRLRRVRLHDLRHGQASLMLAAGVDMAIVSKRLRHSTVTITTDLYSHLLGGVGRDAAERAASLVPRRRSEQVQPGGLSSQVVPAKGLSSARPMAQQTRKRRSRRCDRFCTCGLRWGGWDSNPRPTDYESAALTG